MPWLDPFTLKKVEEIRSNVSEHSIVIRTFGTEGGALDEIFLFDAFLNKKSALGFFFYAFSQ